LFAGWGDRADEQDDSKKVWPLNHLFATPAKAQSLVFRRRTANMLLTIVDTVPFSLLTALAAIDQTSGVDFL